MEEEESGEDLDGGGGARVGAVDEAPMWRWSTWCRGTRGGGVVDKEPVWRQSLRRRGARGGGVVGEASTWR
jgi:hypothetical protein